MRKKELDITNVSVEHTLLSWLSPIVEQFDKVIMTQQQLDVFCPNSKYQWKYIRGVLIEIKT